MSKLNVFNQLPWRCVLP